MVAKLIVVSMVAAVIVGIVMIETGHSVWAVPMAGLTFMIVAVGFFAVIGGQDGLD